MKRLFLLLLFTASTFISFGQIIRGQVLDFDTRKPVDYASVYFNGTFAGTTTNKNGEFEIDVTSYANRALHISAIGYRSTFLKYLKAVYEILEVSLESKSLSKERKRCMRIFKDEFLGSSTNSPGYQITYYLDKFEYDKVHKTTAFSGNIVFNLDMASSSQNKKEFEKQRKKTYYGSCIHFFSALFSNELSTEGSRALSCSAKALSVFYSS